MHDPQLMVHLSYNTVHIPLWSIIRLNKRSSRPVSWSQAVTGAMVGMGDKPPRSAKVNLAINSQNCDMYHMKITNTRFSPPSGTRTTSPPHITPQSNVMIESAWWAIWIPETFLPRTAFLNFEWEKVNFCPFGWELMHNKVLPQRSCYVVQEAI